MNIIIRIAIILLFLNNIGNAQDIAIFQKKIHLPTIEFNIVNTITSLEQDSIAHCLREIEERDINHEIVTIINNYKSSEKIEDWLFFQIVRRTAHYYAPKQKDYYAYTLMKYYLLRESGFKPMLITAGERLLLFIKSEDEVYDIPFFEYKNEKYICLNAHDYGIGTQLNEERLLVYNEISYKSTTKNFSYTITHLPDFPMDSYEYKTIVYNNGQKNVTLPIKVNKEINTLLNNYPSTSFANYFNIPLSPVTQESVLNSFRHKLKKMSTRDGLSLLLHFSRSAFGYEADQEQFGKEKRMIAEQTILSDKSDCDDRAALFYYLVKELYDLPMIVIVYPSHINVAVAIPGATEEGSITYNGRKYLVCEPTPQGIDLSVGQQHPRYKDQSYEIAFEYIPKKQ